MEKLQRCLRREKPLPKNRFILTNHEYRALKAAGKIDDETEADLLALPAKHLHQNSGAGSMQLHSHLISSNQDYAVDMHQYQPLPDHLYDHSYSTSAMQILHVAQTASFSEPQPSWHSFQNSSGREYIVAEHSEAGARVSFMHECEPAVPLLRNSDDSEEDFAEFDSGGRLLDSVSESTEEEFALLLLDEVNVAFALLAVIELRDMVGEVNAGIQLLLDPIQGQRSVRGRYEDAGIASELTCAHCDEKFAPGQMKTAIGHLWTLLAPALDGPLYVCASCGHSDSSANRREMRLHCRKQHQIERPLGGYHFVDYRLLYQNQLADRSAKCFAETFPLKDTSPKAATFGTDRIVRLVLTRDRLIAYWYERYRRIQAQSSDVREVKCRVCGELVDILGGLQCPPVIHVWAHVIRSLKTHGPTKRVLHCERCEFGCLDDIAMLQHVKLNPECRILDHRSQFRHEFGRLWANCFPFIPLAFYVKFAFARRSAAGFAWRFHQQIRFLCPFCGVKVDGPGAFSLHLQWKHEDKELEEVEIDAEVA